MAQELIRRVRSPTVVVAAATPTIASHPRAQKKVSNPCPSPRGCNSPSFTRQPLSLSEKDNAAAPRRPRGKEVASRHLASSFSSSSCSSAAKDGSLSSASAAAPSSKGASFTSSYCSVSIASSSSSTATSTSPWRFHSPLPTPRPSTPPALPQTYIPTRSKSADRTRPAGTTTTHRGAHNPVELSSAARSLRTTTRSLSVSFQGESFSYQTSKTRPVSPSPSNRKSTPERRVPAATPARSSLKSENPRPFDNLHRWPAARNQQFNLLTRSLDCSEGEKDSIFAAVRSLRQYMVRNEVPRRASFDGGDISLAFDTDSFYSASNSGSPDSCNLPPRQPPTPYKTDVPVKLLQEQRRRLGRLPGQLSPSTENLASTKLVPTKKSLMSTACSPGKLSALSPRSMSGFERVRSSPAKGSSPVTLPGNEQSIFGFTANRKRGKNGQSWIEDAHQLRLLYNRYLQWRWVNAQAIECFLVQKSIAERYLCHAWTATTKMHEYVAIKKLKLQTDSRHLKLNSILKGQTTYLEEWSLIHHDHLSTLSGALEILQTITTTLPIVDGAMTDFHEVRNAVGSAVDVMQAIGNFMCTVLPRVEGRSSMMFELAELATRQQALLDECRDIVSTVSAMHVKQCSLLGHLLQMRRPRLVQL